MSDRSTQTAALYRQDEEQHPLHRRLNRAGLMNRTLTGSREQADGTGSEVQPRTNDHVHSGLRTHQVRPVRLTGRAAQDTGESDD